MHIPDGILSPGVTAATLALGAGGLGLCLRGLMREADERLPVRMGVLAAFVFAAQMVNFPVGPGVSGHLMGGVLTAAVVGPYAAAVVLFSVLLVQAVLFADGGVLALGANFVNIGLIGAVAAHGLYQPLRRRLGGNRGIVIGAMAAAWFSVILAAAAFAVELAASGRVRDFPRILGWMVLVHAVIGLGEALITGLVLRFVLQVRPDVVAEASSGPARRPWVGETFAGLGIALAVVVFLAPLASQHPDGLEFVGERLEFLGVELPALLRTPLADYEVSGLTRRLGIASAVAGAVGTLAVFVVGALLARPFAQAGAASVASPSPVPETHCDVRPS